MKIKEKDSSRLSTTERIMVESDIPEPNSPIKDAFHQLRKNRLAVFGFFIIIFFILLGLFAPLISPYDYKEQVLSDRLLPPSSEHWFGTDDLGRDRSEERRVGKECRRRW